MKRIIRPEIVGRAAYALEYMARERSNEVHKVSCTELINLLLLEEWNRVHLNETFPDENGELCSEDVH